MGLYETGGFGSQPSERREHVPIHEEQAHKGRYPEGIRRHDCAAQREAVLAPAVHRLPSFIHSLLVEYLATIEDTAKEPQFFLHLWSRYVACAKRHILFMQRAHSTTPYNHMQRNKISYSL
jgi:hypothetical protein